MFKSIAPHLRRGKKGEKLAARYLKQQGLRIVANNVSSRRGEIDLIAKEDEVLVFVEVRLRQKDALVSAAESITPAKLKKCRLAAQAYLQANYDTLPDCRFDAILITEDKGRHEIEWLRGIAL